MNDYEKMSDREIAELVAVRVLGLYEDKASPLYPGPWFRNFDGSMFFTTNPKAPTSAQPGRFFAPCTDPSAWWEVVEHFDVGFVQIDNGWRTAPHDRGWTVKIVVPGQEGEATAVNIGRAVCIAALRALDAQAGGA